MDQHSNILAFLETLYTPLVSDVMDKLGINNQVLDHSIQSMIFDPHLKIAGYAFPCQVIPTEEYVEIDTLLEMVDAIPNDSIVLVASKNDIDAALWGGLMSTRAKANGAKAAVVNGGVRDIEQIAEIGFPVFGSYRCVKDIRKRGYMSDYNCKITIGNVVVKPQDIIFSDINGIVVIPSDRFDEIFSLLKTTLENEQQTMSALTKGRTAREVFETYKTF